MTRLDRAAPSSSRAPALAFDPEGAAAASSATTDVVGRIRIDHRRDLAAALGIAVGELLDLDDAAVLLRAWERWGVDCFARIEGDFAAAIWDRRERRLVLARDALGQRPLFYRRFGTGLAFAALPLPLAHLSGPARPDLQRLAGFLAGQPETGERSFIAGVQRVQPGHWVMLNGAGALAEQRWWNPDLTPLRLSLADGEDAVSCELRRAVAGMLSPAGILTAADLSGGLDSSLVVVTAAALAPERLLALTGESADPFDRPADCFLDEGERAAETAEAAGVPHRRVAVPPESPLAGLERWLPSSQAPFANACNLGWMDALYGTARAAGAATYLVGARGNMTVSRNGIGRLAELAGNFRLGTLGQELSAYRSYAGGSWPGLLALAFGHLVPTAVWNRLAPPHRARHSDPSGGAMLNPASPFLERGVAQDAPDESPAAAIAAMHMVDEGTTYHSVACRFGLDVRDPLGSRRLVELCARLPAEHYFGGGRPRRLARTLLAGKAPERVVNARKRGYQGANWRAGFERARPQLLAEVEAIDADPELGGLLDVARMRATLQAWPGGNWTDWGQIETYRFTLMQAIGAARFARFVRESGG
ncbi:asparagine synthase-related protein [Sphingomonas sp.]|uniref:asparagine synthase-related protein n=1 Tax=Sphingomonas sp. TaxID=28214 RepID=UPI00286D7BFB|nr:asparagine synthase-related protein [Sphingomonas sp.]